MNNGVDKEIKKKTNKETFFRESYLRNILVLVKTNLKFLQGSKALVTLYF